MDDKAIAKDLTAAYIAKEGLPNEKDLEQVAKQLANFYRATLQDLQGEGTGEITSVDRQKKSGGPWE